MAARPLIVFDVNETLLDLGTMEPTFQRIFGDKNAMRLWFANLILYSVALTVADSYIPFTDIGSAVMKMLADTRGIKIRDEDKTRNSASMPASTIGHLISITVLRPPARKVSTVYFENVGGAVFEAVFPLLNQFARIPVCGLISMYNATSLSPGSILLPRLMRATLTKRLTFRGFIVSDFSARYGDFMRDVSAWVREGRIKYREDVVEGLENAPRALIGLLRGENFGKLLVRVAR
jgi:hypothetical protein